MLRDSVERFVALRYDFATRTRIAQTPGRFSPEIWQALADFGWLALPLPAVHSGLGGGAVDVGILMEGFGRALLLEPYLSTVVLGGGLIAATGSDAQCSEMLPQIAAGGLRVAFAHLEPQDRFGFDTVTTQANESQGSWLLRGRKTMVIDGPGASRFIVSARVRGGDDLQRAGVGLFVVPRGAQGLDERRFETLDGHLASMLTFDGVRVDRDAWLGGSDDTAGAVDTALDHALAALTFEAVGCMQVLLDATVSHARARIQFGQPLAANQVLRHRMVDMAVQCEEARAMALRAALACDADAGGDHDGHCGRRRAATSGAKLKIGRGGRFVAEQAVQLHGAMGVTGELNIGAYFKRLLAFELMLGTPAWHQRRRMALGTDGQRRAA